MICKVCKAEVAPDEAHEHVEQLLLSHEQMVKCNYLGMKLAGMLNVELDLRTKEDRSVALFAVEMLRKTTFAALGVVAVDAGAFTNDSFDELLRTPPPPGGPSES